MLEPQTSKNADKKRKYTQEEAQNEQINENDSDCSKSSSGEPELDDITIPKIIHVISKYDSNESSDEEPLSKLAQSRNEAAISPSTAAHVHSVHDSTLNTVDNLLKKKFSQHSYEKQLEIKRLGAHQPQDVKISQTRNNKTRNFSIKWFERFEWLTVSVSNSRFYCFYCLLFTGDTSWNSSGYNNLKNLSEKVKTHAASKNHMSCSVKYKLFGVTSLNVQPKRVATEEQSVDSSRSVLEMILSCIKFCSAHGLKICESQVFRELVGEVPKFDNSVKEQLQDSSWTSRPVLNGLLDAVSFVYQQELVEDVQKASFIAIQVDYLPSRDSKFAIFLRYVKNYVPTERLYSFIKLETNTAVCLAESIQKELQRLDILGKLIAQSYDGYITVSGPFCGVHNLMMSHFPQALYIHSCAYSLQTIVWQSCSSIPCIKTFFANSRRFASFFAKSSRQNGLLNVEHGYSWGSEMQIITSLYLNQNELSHTFEKIMQEYAWDDKTVWQAASLCELINDNEFTFLVPFFYTIFNYVEVLLKKYEERRSTGDVMSAVQTFESAIVNLMEVVKQAPESRFRTACIDTCGIVISEARERIEANDHLITFAVVDPAHYKQTAKLPTDHLSVIECRYRMLLHKKLTNELKSLYNNLTYFNMTSESDLLKNLNNHKLVETFSELCKFIEIILATPKERIGQRSASGKLQDFLDVNSEEGSREFILAVLAIHSDAIDNIPNFNNRVIDRYKSVT